MKRDYFKISLIILILAYVVVQYLDYYLEVKRHNLDTITEMRGCYSTFKEFNNQEVLTSCFDRAKEQKVKFLFAK